MARNGSELDTNDRIAAMRREEAASIAALFESYAAGFDDFDVDRVLDLFEFPCVIWQFGKGHVFEDEDELAENIEALFKVYEREAIVRSIPKVEEIAVLGPLAIARVDWTAETDDGETAFAFSVGYHLGKEAGEWFILAVVNEDSDEPPPLPAIPLPPTPR